MAMDRTMYGKVQPGATYQPFRITVKKGSLPGYALLADLQNTVSSEGNHVSSNATPGYGSLNGARTHNTNAYRSYESRTSPLPSQSDCRQKFQGGSFFDHEGLPYCETHYHAKRGSLCAGCHKPITGRCITAMFRKFHPEHFVCAFCLKQLNKGTFKEQNDKPYCHGCFDKLFG
ncbi:paxillin-like isoform X2 [Vespa velutina]|uniref:paxillin-like isoform X2 n=1 Tax=Vespa velutina TaxID=202808 RepID=UPI001FB333B6|nr:paxillin-like isoform X2 [Vespa velutina]XP_047345978.1 paxillin-like isoform X2 [Vespa velutina]